MSSQANEPGNTVAATRKLVLCSVNNGPPFSTTPDDCLSTPGGRIVDKGHANPSPGTLIPYRLPSRNEVVGTYESLLADNGNLVDLFDSRDTTPSNSGETELFVCRLPSGIGVVATYDECLADGGMVIGKLPGRTQK